MDTRVLIDGNEQKVTVASKKETDLVDGIRFYINPKRLSFNIGDKIVFNFNHWNDFRLTLSMFLSQLIHALPVPDEVKQSVPKGFNAVIALKNQGK